MSDEKIPLQWAEFPSLKVQEWLNIETEEQIIWYSFQKHLGLVIISHDKDKPWSEKHLWPHIPKVKIQEHLKLSLNTVVTFHFASEQTVYLYLDPDGLNVDELLST